MNILDRVIPKEDGLYFLVDYNKKNPKKDVLYLIQKYKLKDVDYEKASEEIDNKHLEILITPDVKAINLNEKVEVIVSKDKLKAEVTFIPPEKNGRVLEKDEIIKEISKVGITFGLDLSVIDEFINDRDYLKDYLIAQGKEPEESKDGFLEYCVEISKKTPKPKILDDGTIDYKTLNLFENINKGTILAIRIDPIKGSDGKDIFGNIVESKVPEPAPNLPKGKNTEISPDGKRLLASINGYISKKDKLINILPVLEIKSDVDNSTGNIDFLGTVIIRGNVLADFTIKAEGNVNIYGWVEGATIISEGSIFIAKGIQGAGKGTLIAEEDVNVNFVENTTIIAEKDIIASSMMHCNVFCNGNVTVLGKRGLILGGKTIVRGDLIVREIGSSLSNNTDITLGINYKVLNKYEEIGEKIDTMSERYSTLEKIVNKLSKIEIEYLSKDKRKLLEKSVKEKLELKRKILKYKQDLLMLIPLFTKTKSKLSVKNNLYGGTKIVINDAIMFIKEDIESCVLQNVDGKIEVFK